MMCDYSLHNVASRPAVPGDRLETARFPNSLIRGCCDIEDRTIAICLRPGTEIAFEREAEREHPFAKLLPRFGFGKIGAPLAALRLVHLADPHTRHESLEFANGTIVLPTRLRPGQRATVLQLPVETLPTDENDVAAQVASPDDSPYSAVR